MNPWILGGGGLVLISLVFLVAWMLSLKWDNFSIVDAVWAFGIGLVGVCWLACSGSANPKILVAGAILLIWSLRLGLHLERRIRKAHPEEDSRYAKLREVWVGRVPSAFFWFFQGQAASVVLLALPFLMIALDSDRAWSAWESAGLTVALIGICGESLADAQMTRFKSVNSDSRKICQTGLWRYSRHPNYFFESVIWFGFYIYACGSAWGWTTIHAPAIITFLLLKVTGIPPTEASAVKRKGDAYRRYQQTTSAFIPWPPKRLE